MKRHLAGTLVVLLLVSSVAASIGPLGVTAQEESSSTVQGSPELSTYLPDSSVAPGRTNQVMIQISNDGELISGLSSERSVVTTARNVRLEADADGTPLTVETDESSLGSISEDQPREAPISVTVPDDVEPGTYTIDVDLTYSHTYLQSDGTAYDRTRTERTEVEVEVEDTPRFSIGNATTDAAIGESGSLELAIENTGSQTAYDVQPVVESTTQGMAFGQSNVDTGHVDSIDPGETVTVTYDVQVSPDARVRSYPISTTVRFEDPDGVERSEPNLSAGVTPLPEQTFDVSNVTTDLRVNEKGTFEATVSNEGPRSVRNAVAALQSGTPNVEIPTPTQSVGNLDPGEQRTVEFDANVGPSVTAGTQQFDIVVNYTNGEGDRYPSDTIETNATIRPRQDRFDVERTSADLRVNEEGS
ncbi:MAG: COG1361 S-layer family protein, partial [Halodesulfurarchaeum sp.]